MANYWKKLNLEMISPIYNRATIASKKKEDYIEAAILQAALVESALRTAITSKVGSRKKLFRKYWDGDAWFATLVDYYELLGGKKLLIKRLREYNGERNKIVHHILKFNDIHSLVRTAKKNYLLGKKLDLWLLKEAYSCKTLKELYRKLGISR